jgi:hypothetical protein
MLNDLSFKRVTDNAFKAETDKVLMSILDELISNDMYRLTWTYDYPQLKIFIGQKEEDKNE